ncbi:MAG: hypothetical protein JST60_21040 [Chloroflexi bacterium SZAS-1]|jgi:DNA-binding CsgD family transcriptional regulator|nr:hypothetical protein [Chloroflexi bacterium SZAS-1]
MKNPIHLTEEQIEILYRAQKLDSLLTVTERRVARFATLGHANKEIAIMLSISPKTVGRHIESITNKARRVYGSHASFRNLTVPELHAYYFLID